MGTGSSELGKLTRKALEIGKKLGDEKYIPVLETFKMTFELPHGQNQQNDRASSVDRSAWASAQSDQSLCCVLNG